METIETRKTLTEIQFRNLLDAQLKLERAKSELENAKAHFEQISQLVIDAVGLPTGNVESVVLEVSTRELVVVTTL